MATQLQIRRGTTAQMTAFTGAEGELAVNTSTDTVHVHDGSTAGGFALAKADGSNIGTYAGSFTTLAASGASTLTGAVGINIAPTSYKLTVNSGATTETTAAAIGYNGDVGTNLYINTDHGNNLVSLYASGSASKEMRFLSGSLEVMRLGTTGNVGIGVSNPSDYYANNLVVGAGSEGGITIASSATTYNNYLAFADGSSSVARYAGLISYDHNINDMHFRTNSLERMRIDSSGNALVGRTGRLTGQSESISSDTVVSVHGVLAQHQTNAGILQYNGNVFSLRAYGASAGTGAIAFNTGGGGGGADSERMRLTAAGKLGINNSSPAYSLSICNPANPNRNGMEIAIGAGDTSSNTIQNYNRATGAYTPLNIAGSILTFGSGGGATERFRIAANGSISIPNQNAINELTFTGAEFTNVVSATTSGFQFGTTGAGYLAFLTNNSEKARILPTGGITFNGDTAQANALDDYEEGTFTVGFSNAAISATNTTGLYTKIGRQVYWTYYSQASTISSASGPAQITGLPFTVKNDVDAYQPFFTAHNSFFGGSATVGVSGYHSTGTNNAVFINTGSAVSSTYVNGSGKYLMISGFYLTDE